MGKTAVLEIFLIVGRHDDQVGAFLPCLPKCFACLNTIFLCLVVLGKDDAVAHFLASANRYRVPFQPRIQHTLDTCIEIVHVTMQDCPFHAGTSRCILTEK